MVGSLSGCCERTSSGHDAATPPSSATNSRRPMPDTGFPPSQWVCHTIRLPPTEWQVPLADLNSSEFRGLPLWMELTPHLGDMQIARALILSHAGKKPLARYRGP